MADKVDGQSELTRVSDFANVGVWKDAESSGVLHVRPHRRRVPGLEGVVGSKRKSSRKDE